MPWHLLLYGATINEAVRYDYYLFFSSQGFLLQPAAFPWYDSSWLANFVRVKAHITANHPARLADFNAAFEPLRTAPGFRLKQVSQALDAAEHEELKALIAGLQPSAFELHEMLRFGRLVIHDHELVSRIQARLVPHMSAWVNEEVEPCYNFLSLYNNLGICNPHMDAPSAKWTFDYCIGQSGPWPIHFSEVIAWPETWQANQLDWVAQIKNDPHHHFTAHELQERDAIVFAGSSQWHYRDRIQRTHKHNFCHLVFMHYIPKGTSTLVKEENWATLFAMPELDAVIVHSPGQADHSKIRL